MSDVAVIRNEIGRDWMHHLHVASPDVDLLGDWMAQIPGNATVDQYVELRIHHLKAQWTIRGAVRMMHGYRHDVLLPLAIWWIGQDRISKLIPDAVCAFRQQFSWEPTVAFLRHLPAKATDLMDVHGVTLTTAEWVADGYLAVAGGGWKKTTTQW
jgi:hypothetical protein